MWLFLQRICKVATYLFKSYCLCGSAEDAFCSKSGVPQGTVGSNPTLSASDFFQYFNPSNACLQVIDLIDLFLPKLPPILKKVTL